MTQQQQQQQQPPPPYYYYPVPLAQNQLKKYKIAIIALSITLGLSLLLNILLALVAIGFISPGNLKEYNTYNSAAELDSKGYAGELVQFRASPFDLYPITGKSNEYAWRISGKDYSVVLRFPPGKTPVAKGVGLYYGKVLGREVYGDFKETVILIDEANG